MERMPNRPGAERKAEYETCPVCKGKGELMTHKEEVKCSRCNGSGKIRSAK